MTIKVFVGYHAGDDKGFANCEILDNKMENGVIRVKCLDGACMEGEVLRVAYNGNRWDMVKWPYPFFYTG